MPAITGPIRVAVLDDFQGVALGIVDWEAGLPGAQVVSFTDHLTDEDALADRLGGFDVVVAMRERTRFGHSLLERLPNLRLLVTTGMRTGAIDFETANRLGIPVVGTRSLPWGAAELTWGLILALARRIPAEDATIRAGGWQESVGTSLHGKTLGIVGLGKLGAKAAEVARVFGMEVVAWSPNLTTERAAERDVLRVERGVLFTTADVVTIHMVLGDGTRGLIGEAELRAMKPTAFLVNTSRGPIVDRRALLRALEEGWIAGAGLDVFDEEPLARDDPLRRAPRTILTPHLGYVTDDNYRVFFTDAVECIQAWLTGTPLRRLEQSGW
jgi:phosphoglycerate dehydrogenase-like enzyme